MLAQVDRSVAVGLGLVLALPVLRASAIGKGGPALPHSALPSCRGRAKTAQPVTAPGAGCRQPEKDEID